MTEQPHEQDTAPTGDPTIAFAGWAGRCAAAAALQPLASEMLARLTAAATAEQAKQLSGCAAAEAAQGARAALQQAIDLLEAGAFPDQDTAELLEAISGVIASITASTTHHD